MVQFHTDGNKQWLDDNGTRLEITKTIISHGSELYVLPNNSTGRKFLGINKATDGFVLEPRSTAQTSSLTTPSAPVRTQINYAAFLTGEEREQFEKLLEKAKKLAAVAEWKAKVEAAQKMVDDLTNQLSE